MGSIYVSRVGVGVTLALKSEGWKCLGCLFGTSFGKSSCPSSALRLYVCMCVDLITSVVFTGGLDYLGEENTCLEYAEAIYGERWLLLQFFFFDYV